MIFPLDVTLQIRLTWLIPSLTDGFWTVMPSRSGHAGVPLLLTGSILKEGSGTLKGEHGFLLSQGTLGVSALLFLSSTVSKMQWSPVCLHAHPKQLLLQGKLSVLFKFQHVWMLHGAAAVLLSDGIPKEVSYLQH